MQDKGIFNTFSKVEPINKGWSEDKKYCVTKADGTKYLLRITPIARYETRKALFEILQRVAALGIPMCKPIEFGTCEDGVYALHSWIDGEDAEKAISHMTETEQYLLGLKSGEILRKIHSIPAPEVNSNGLTLEEWEPRFNHKTNIKIQKYRECGLRFVGDDKIIEYIDNNRHLLGNRPQSFQHGDYHIGNMMLENGELRIIDFDRFDFGDPWEEFNRIVWCATVSPHFATGQLRGYFGGEPPLEFFKLLAFYISSNTLSSIYWAIPFGQSEIDTMMKQSQDVLTWYDNMNNPVPTWYLKDLELSSFQETDKERQARIYPIILSEYNPAWSEWYVEEKANLERLIGTESIARISHYGSTSVPGLTAKPTIDILLEIKENTDINKLITALPSPDYICLSGAGLTVPTPSTHLMFLKGYLPDGFAEKVYHIHVRYPCDDPPGGDWDELYFRDYLISHPETAAEYTDLKRRLFKDYEHDRDGYTGAKTAFIRAVTEKARKT